MTAPGSGGSEEVATDPLVKDIESYQGMTANEAELTNYDEDMEPWILDDSGYHFRAHSNIKQNLCCLGTLQYGYSVYHCKNSDFITFKKRDEVKTRPNSVRNWAFGLLLCGILSIVAGGVGFGVFFLLIGMSLFLIYQNSFVYAIEEIRISDICYVERQLNEGLKCLCLDFGSLTCCSEYSAYVRSIKYSLVNIGVKHSFRINISDKLGNNSVKKISVWLTHEDAYKLHRYLENLVRNSKNNMTKSEELTVADGYDSHNAAGGMISGVTGGML